MCTIVEVEEEEGLPRAVCSAITPTLSRSFQIVDSLGELEALMERMKRLQEDRGDEETTREEMTTRFEKEKKESLFVVPGESFHSFPHSGALFLAFG